MAKKIVISAGHSNTDLGAVADHNGDKVNDYKEADFCADFRNYVAYYLRNWGLPVTTDGEGRTNAPLSQAIKLATGADLAIEFHLNASSDSRAYGVECLANVKHKTLCQKICQAIVNVTGSRLRGEYGYKAEDAGQHSRLGFVRAGGIIVELEFVSSPKFMSVLNDKRWVVAKAVAEVIKNHVQGG